MYIIVICLIMLTRKGEINPTSMFALFGGSIPHAMDKALESSFLCRVRWNFVLRGGGNLIFFIY